MKKQELCQLLSNELKKEFNALEINNICNYIWSTINKMEGFIDSDLAYLTSNTPFQSWIDELHAGIPVQYVLGNACFYGLDLEVNSNVLIPRSETEELVSWLLSDSKDLNALHVLDIGTGSACIPIVLKRYHPQWNITAIDVSNAALDVAKRNASMYQLDIEFIELDFLADKNQLKNSYDIIVSNPPYISHLESNQISASVLLEPHVALFPQGNDPLVFYKAIASWAKQNLSKSGSIYLEMNEFLVPEIREIFQNEAYSRIEIRNDLQGKKRMIKVQF